MKIFDIVNEEKDLNEAQQWQKIVDQLFENGHIDPINYHNWANPDFLAEADGWIAMTGDAWAGLSNDFSYSLNNQTGQVQVRDPDGRIYNYPNQDMAKADIRTRDLAYRARTGPVQGPNGKWYVNYGNTSRTGGPNDQLEFFDNERDANRAYRQFSRKGRITRPIRSWHEYRSVAAAHAQQNNIRNYSQKINLVQTRWQGWWRTLKWAGYAGYFALSVINAVSVWNTMKQVMSDLAVDLAFGVITEEQYMEGRNYMIGWLGAQFVTFFGVAVASGAGVMQVIKWIKRIRNAIAIGSAAFSGPIGPIISFLVGGVISYAAGWFLSRKVVQETIVGWIVSSLDTEMGETEAGLLENIMRIVFGDGARIASDIMSGPTSAVISGFEHTAAVIDDEIDAAIEAGQDQEQRIGLDPRADDAQRLVRGGSSTRLNPNANEIPSGAFNFSN